MSKSAISLKGYFIIPCKKQHGPTRVITNVITSRKFNVASSCVTLEHLNENKENMKKY